MVDPVTPPVAPPVTPPVPPPVTPPTTPPTPPVTPPTTEPPKAPEAPKELEPIIGKTAAEAKVETDAAKAPITDPTKYTEFKLPTDFEANEPVMAAAKKIFAEEGMSQTTAQRMVDFHTEQLLKAADQPYQEWTAMQKQWQDEVNADKEIGGTNLPAVKSTIAKALDAYGDKGVLEALMVTGAGNNPAIIRTFYKMAKALTEGKMIQGSPAGAKPTTQAAAMYPNLPTRS